MGVLDDAIREHLDLRRRQGVNEEDIARSEAEALGPVRREVEPAGEDGGPSGDELEPALLDEPLPEEPVPLEVEEPVGEPPLGEPSPFTEPELLGGSTRIDSADDAHRYEAPAESELLEIAEGEPLDDEPLDGDPPVEPRFDPPQEAPEPPADPAADDVLEETPDFLQETPEHERLWFEQRSPRDFDFDD